MNDAQNLYAQAISALEQGNWPKLEQLVAMLLPRAPQHVGILYLAGVAALELHKLPRAIECLARAAELQPDRADVLTQLARAFSMARQNPLAILTAHKAFRLFPDDPRLLDTLGAVYSASNAHASAADVYRHGLALSPSNVAFRYNLATTLVNIGDALGAEREISRCLEQDPTFWRAHLTLAHLRKQSADHNHIERLSHLLARHAADHDAEICLNMALAKEYEDLGNYPLAFDHLARGKKASGRGLNYAASQDSAIFSALKRAVPQAAPTRTVGHPSDEPIFVFGMPRSGTTLIDRILSSHPQAVSMGELQSFGIALRKSWKSSAPLLNDPHIAMHAQQVDWHQVGEDYLKYSRPANPDTPHFVDKLPHNFLYAGFIAMAFPNAKIICLRRHAMDTCLSNFRQLFAEKLPYYHYSYDLLDTGRYYVEFDRMMAHWQEIFPERILELHYESLIESAEATVRNLLDYCDLPWDEKCMHFEDNPDAVGTASALQVREPLYSSAMHRWRRYEGELTELKSLLIEAGIDL